MSLITFTREGGEKLFDRPPTAVDPTVTAPGAPDVAALNETASRAIERYIASQGLRAYGLDVKYDGATQTVTVSGVAPDQATKERIVLCCGNVAAVARVNDLLTVASGGDPAFSSEETNSRTQFATRVALLVIVVSFLAAVVGFFLLPGTTLGFGLTFGGSLLAYEAFLLFSRKTRKVPSAEKELMVSTRRK